MSPEIVLADFFSGCGGTTRGFVEAGIQPVLAVDWDADAVATFRKNFPETRVIEQDIRELKVEDVEPELRKSSRRSIRLFAGCAPCQPFAGHQRKSTGNDSRSSLLLEFLRFVKAFSPELVFVENVPGIQRLSDSEGPLTEFLEEISSEYEVSHDIISSADYGVPQTRHRFVLLASRLGEVGFPSPTHGSEAGRSPYTTVRDWIGGLSEISAGQENSADASHRAMKLSTLNLERIQATPEGGDRRDWPPELLPDCHRGDFNGHTDVYGRMSWDKLAPTLTTKCISYSNGRFGHPRQHRGLSAREAACLQTFPLDFQFAGGLTSQARQIGNAVPVLLAECFGRHMMEHVAEYAEYNERSTIAT